MTRTRGGRGDHYFGGEVDQPEGCHGAQSAIMGEQRVTAGPVELVVG